ncbi:hypothetical protein Aperf_G00000108765 [Anoplocephala perfoliata]
MRPPRWPAPRLGLPDRSVVNGWTQTLQSLEAEAKAHQDVSEKISAQLLPISKNFIAAAERDTKPIFSEIEAVSSRLQTARRDEWKNRKKAFHTYRITCRNLSNATGSINNNSRFRSFDNGNTDTGSRTATLLLRKRSPQSPLPASSSPYKTTGISSSSLRRVATLSTSRPSMEINGSGSQSVLPAKAARSVWRAILDLYRSSIANEEARIEWNSTLYQNTFKLFDLERLRLKSLQETLESYRSTITDSIQIVAKALQSTKEAVARASVDEDFLAFHGKAVVKSDSTPEQSSTTTSRLTNHKSVFHHKPKPQPMAVVGSTQQNLFCLPGEADSLYTPSESMQRQSIQHALQKQFLVFFEEAPHSVSNDELGDSLKKSEKAAFARQLLMSILEILARECQKEERTKQGLTNLVMVYSTKPEFTDDATLIEARRRLFSSRCRLAYLLACRARLACLFHLLSSSVHSNSLQKRLKDAGFTAVESDQTFSKWVDVTMPPNPPSIQLEWPPVTSEVVNFESIPSLELDVANPLLVNDMSRFSWMAHADNLFGSTRGSSLIDDEDNYIDNDDDDIIDQADDSKATQPSTATSITSNNSTKKDNGVKKPISPSVKTKIERFPARSAGPVPHKATPQITVPSSTTTTSKSAITTPSRLNSTPTKVQASSKIRTPVKTAPQSTKPTPSTTPVKVSAAAAKQSVASPTKQLERELPTSTKALKSSSKTSILSVSKPKPVKSSRSKSTSHAPTPNNSPAFSPVLDDSDAFMDDNTSEDLAKTAPKQPSWQITVQEKRRIALERVNGCGDKLDAKTEEADEMTEPISAKEDDNKADKKKNSPSIFSRMTIRSNKQSKHNQRPQIVTPWRVEPSGNDSTAADPSTADLRAPVMTASSPPKATEAQSPLEMWPSLASLHCIGWAKVTSNYTPQKPGELVLLEGEIVSILQKTTSSWWMGEAGGKSGRFPVSHVEEF